MTTAEIVMAVLGLIQLAMALAIPSIRNLFKSNENLQKENVKLRGDMDKMKIELQGEINENHLRIEHLNGNVKQGMEYLREGIETLKQEFKDIKTELHEILKSKKDD